MTGKGYFSRLESKFTFMYTIILIVVITCIACSIGQYSNSILKKKSLDSCIQKLDFAGERFEQILDRIENESLLLTLNQAARYEAAKKEDNSPYEEHMEAASFSSYLVEFLSTQSAVESISYYSWDGSFFYQDNYGAQPSVKIEVPQEVREEFFHSSKKSFWYIHEPAAPYPGGNLTFTCLKKSFAFTGEPLGFFALTVSPSQIREIYNGFFSEDEIFMITDKNGLICAGTKDGMQGNMVTDVFADGALLTTGSTITLDSTRYLCTFQPEKDLNLFALTPESLVYHDSRSLVSVILAIGIISSIFTFFLFRYSTRKIMLPVNQIIANVRSMSDGDYGVRISTQEGRTDEISLLAGQINQMAKNTQDLLSRVHRENERKRRYELSYLQLQMQPHFLYNTLETLCGMIEMNNKSEAIGLVSLISSFYRDTLGKGKEIITLEQELKITCGYLKIMQKRYPGCFYFETSLEPEVLSCSIPKLTLQPLVENSIIHGLQLFTSDRAGLITITGYQEDSLICLRIADNGSGMDEETVGRLNSQIFSEERSSFGIQSIKKRLKLYFAVADILVTSRISEGTVITIRISQQPEPPL